MQALKGTHDILPDEVYKWDYMEGVIRDVCARYGYKEIRTPIIEATELFQRGIGDTTDVVTKEMYTFKDRGNRSVTLRPENTASAVRAYLEHKMYGDQQVHKMFYIGSMFRYDRPQAGRYREFHQFGLEVLGASSPLADAEVIAMACEIFHKLGLKDLDLHLNLAMRTAVRSTDRSSSNSSNPRRASSVKTARPDSTRIRFVFSTARKRTAKRRLSVRRSSRTISARVAIRSSKL